MKYRRRHLWDVADFKAPAVRSAAGMSAKGAAE